MGKEECFLEVDDLDWTELIVSVEKVAVAVFSCGQRKDCSQGTRRIEVGGASL